MNCLPILERELITSARDWRTCYGRLYAPGVMLLFILWLLWIFRGVPAAGLPGDFIFRFTSYIAFGVAAFGGAMRTSDSISREKREETLVLLFLTDLKGLDVVLGKLLGGSLRAAYGLLATLPVLAVTMMMGGVNGREVVRVGVNLLVCLALSLSLGALVSSMSRLQKRSQSASGLLVLLFIAVIPAGAEALRNQAEWPEAAQILSLFSPVYSQNMAFSTALGLRNNFFWTSILIQLALAITGVALAARITGRTWKLRPPGAKALSWKERWTQWSLGRSNIRAAYRRVLLNRNAFFWLAARDRLAPWWGGLVIAFGVATAVFCIWRYELEGAQVAIACVSTALILDYYFKLRLAGLASQRFGDDRQSGAMELILCTPLQLREIVRGQWLAIRRAFLPPLLALWVIDIALFLSAWALMGPLPNFAPYLFGTYLLVSTGDALALGWISMWKSLRCFNPAQAPGLALLRVAVIPWFVFGILLSALPQWTVTSNWWREAGPHAGMLLGLGVWFVVVAGSALWSRHNLYTHFRDAAADRYFHRNRLLRWARKSLDFLAASRSFSLFVLRKRNETSAGL